MKVTRILISILLMASNAYGAESADPWQYHGIHLGAKMTQEQIMAALGAQTFKRNPEFDPWNNKKGCNEKPEQKICKEADFYKYGFRALEVEQQEVGPYCEDKKPGEFSCVNPFMPASIPNWGDHGHGVVKVWVFVEKGAVRTIDINFDSLSAEDFIGTVQRQLGATGWHSEKDTITITDVSTDHSTQPDMGKITVERTTQTKKTQNFSASVTDYDGIFVHPARPPYQGVLELKVLDQQL